MARAAAKSAACKPWTFAIVCRRHERAILALRILTLGIRTPCARNIVSFQICSGLAINGRLVSMARAAASDRAISGFSCMRAWLLKSASLAARVKVLPLTVYRPDPRGQEQKIMTRTTGVHNHSDCEFLDAYKRCTQKRGGFTCACAKEEERQRLVWGEPRTFDGILSISSCAVLTAVHVLWLVRVVRAFVLVCVPARHLACEVGSEQTRKLRCELRLVAVAVPLAAARLHVAPAPAAARS